LRIARFLEDSALAIYVTRRELYGWMSRNGGFAYNFTSLATVDCATCRVVPTLHPVQILARIAAIPCFNAANEHGSELKLLIAVLGDLVRRAGATCFLVPTRIPILFLARVAQYLAVLHCGQTLNSFSCPTTSHSSLTQYVCPSCATLRNTSSVIYLVFSLLQPVHHAGQDIRGF